MPRQTIEQKRAGHAWEEVQKINISPEFLSLVRGCSATILTAGLGQTVAFYRAKARKEKEHNKPHQDFLNILSDWLLKLRNEENRSPSALVQKIIEGDSVNYRQLTAESLAYLNWLKRFTEAKAP